MVQEEYPKSNIPMECQVASFSDKVACHCYSEEAKGLRKHISEHLKMDGDLESSSPYVVQIPKYSRVMGVLMFGLILFWCALNWEALMMGHVDHQFTNTNHDPFFRLPNGNPLNYYKVVLQGPNGTVIKCFFDPQMKGMIRKLFELFEER